MNALTRLVQEAVFIETDANMNSKSEWRLNAKPRPIIERTEWIDKKLRSKMLEKELLEDNKIRVVYGKIEKLIKEKKTK